MFGLNLSKIHLAGYGLALAIIAYLLFNPRVEHVPIEYEEDESMRDTTTVVKTVTDTVTVYDTTQVSLEIPEPVENDSTKKYTTNYSDSFITARITSTVEGILHSQDLWYVRQVKHVETNHWKTTTINRYLKPTRVFEDPYRNNPKGLWGGVNIENIGNDIGFTPHLMFVNGNIAYELGYNVNSKSSEEFRLEALRIGAKIKIF